MKIEIEEVYIVLSVYFNEGVYRQESIEGVHTDLIKANEHKVALETTNKYKSEHKHCPEEYTYEIEEHRIV